MKKIILRNNLKLINSEINLIITSLFINYMKRNPESNLN